MSETQDSNIHSSLETMHGGYGAIVSIGGSEAKEAQENNESGGISLRQADRISLTELDGFKLAALGPMVIQEDGTIGRISNWATMTPQEQAVAQRLITARNRRRVEELNAAGEAAAVATAQS
jgi:hypothetical protein